MFGVGRFKASVTSSAESFWPRSQHTRNSLPVRHVGVNGFQVSLGLCVLAIYGTCGGNNALLSVSVDRPDSCFVFVAGALGSRNNAVVESVSAILAARLGRA